MDRHQNSDRLRWFQRWLPVVFCLGVFCLGWSSFAYGDPPQSAGQPVPPAVASEVEARIQEWVTGLSSQEYATRRRAFLELWKQGPIALPAVRRALTTSDQQTISAAKVLENLLNLDISPSDNDELAELLQLSGNNWEATLQSLGQKGYWRLAAEVMRSNTELLMRIREGHPPNRFASLIQHAFDQGDAFQAWPVVAQCLSAERRFVLTELTRQQLNRYYKGDIPAEIEKSLDIVDEASLTVDERALHFLYSGRIQEAWDLQPNPRVKQRIIFHTGQWERLNDPTVVPLILGVANNNVLHRARMAAFSRMAGDQAKSAELISALRKELTTDETSQQKDAQIAAPPELINAFVLCGEGDLVEKMVARSSANIDIDYYTHHLQYDKIFKKFGLDPTLKDFDEWIVELPGKLNPNGPQAKTSGNSFENYIELARFLVHLGFREQAKKLYTTTLESTSRSSGRDLLEKWNDVGTRAEDHQLRKFLIEYLDEHDQKMKQEERRMIFVQLFPDWQNTVDKLWQFAPTELSEADGKRKRMSLLERLWRYDRSLVQDEASIRLIENWLTTALRESAKGEDSADQSTNEMATVALRLGLRRQALAMVRTEATRNIFADVAEMLTANGSFASAGKWWESAISQSPDRHMWIRRYADVLLMQGEADLAARYESSIWLRPLSNRMMLADDVPYAMIAEKYFEAGDYDLAQQYAHVTVELAELGERNWWARRLANFAMELEDYKTAARASRIFALNLLMAGSTIQRSPIDTVQLFEYYTGQELLCTAAADIQSGRIESALTSIVKFESLLPSGIEICEHCYPLLVKAGHQAEADQLLERCATRMLKHLEVWPNDSNSHNNLAWMLARCNKRLPEAIEHAEKAVQLSDRSPTYVDTLAEAEFLTGHVERAIDLARECTVIDPRHAHYQKQLQRFRSSKR